MNGFLYYIWDFQRTPYKCVKKRVVFPILFYICRFTIYYVIFYDYFCFQLYVRDKLFGVLCKSFFFRVLSAGKFEMSCKLRTPQD